MSESLVTGKFVDEPWQVGQGYKIAIELLNEGRIGIGAQMVGLAQGAFDYAMRYMVTRPDMLKGLQHLVTFCSKSIEEFLKR